MIERRARRSISPLSPAARDTLLVVNGLLLIWFEAVIYSGPERWGLLTLYAGMIGLPAVLRATADSRPTEPPAPGPTSIQPSPSPEEKAL